MFQRSGTLFVLAAILAMTTSIGVDAGERMHRQDVVVKRPDIHHNTHLGDRRFSFDADRRHRHRTHHGVNTYSGDVAVYWRRDVGTWSYGVVDAPVSHTSEQPNAKIIDLSSGRNDCSMENGVCVIRP